MLASIVDMLGCSDAEAIRRAIVAYWLSLAPRSTRTRKRAQK